VLQHRIWNLTGTRPQDSSDTDESAPGWRLGADLRVARLRLGADLEALSAALHIRVSYLQALESGRLDEIPGTAYVLAFLRSYAAALGIDPEETVKRLRAETPLTRKPELSFPSPVPERGIPSMALVLLGLVLAIGAYGGWYELTGANARFAEPVAAVPDRLAPLADAAGIRMTPSPQVASIQPGPVTPLSSRLPTDAVGAYILPSVPPSQAAAMSMPPIVAAPAPVPDRVVLKAKADSWIQVRDKQGNVLINRVLRTGESWVVPADKPQLLLTTGNAGGTDLIVDGAEIPSIGADGTVRRDLPLDPDQLKSLKPSPAQH
jgi:cytoskeleton protein RodZ